MAARLKRISFLRWGLLVLLVECFRLSQQATLGELLRHPRGLARVVDLSVLMRPEVWSGMGVLYFAAVAGIAFRVREQLSGWFVVALLGVLGALEMAVRGSSMPPLANMLAGATLAAWLLGLGFGGDRHGHEAMSGVFGAMLSLSGLAKLRASGLGWVDGISHSLQVYERADSLVPGLPELRLWFAQHPDLCALGAAFTLLVECCGIAFVWPKARRIEAVLVALMFAAMGLSIGMNEQGWMWLALGLGFSRMGDRIGPDATPSQTGAG